MVTPQDERQRAEEAEHQRENEEPLASSWALSDDHGIESGFGTTVSGSTCGLDVGHRVGDALIHGGVGAGRRRAQP